VHQRLLNLVPKFLTKDSPLQKRLVSNGKRAIYARSEFYRP
jgi:hypothetical protein